MSELVLDDVDRGIIGILQKDARTPYTEIAKELGVSDATIHVRVRKLEEAGVIKRYTVVVDREKIGEPLMVYVLVNVRPGKMNEVANQLAQVENIHELHEIHGRYDILLKLIVRASLCFETRLSRWCAKSQVLPEPKS
jgi:Lrp/AsnC family transcriptional regulator for asnA, asnC and gidA